MTDPQHVLLAQELISRIQSGEFQVGDKLPTELELCEQRSLARGTVRQALKHLEDAGLISRRRGAGTTVAPPAEADGYRAFVTNRAEMLAFIQRTRIRRPSANEIVAEEDLASRIGVQVGSSWYAVAGSRVVRESRMPPICWSELYLSAGLPHRRMMLTGKFGLVNLVRQRIEQEVSATILPSSMAAALGAEPGSAAIVVGHRHYNSSDVLEAVSVHTHPADRYRITSSVGSPIAAD